MSDSTRWLAIGVAAVIVVAVVSAILASTRDPVELPAGSPEAVVQAYLRAVADGDTDQASALLSEELESRCDEESVGMPLRRFPGDGPSFRAELLDVEQEGDTARVEVRITEFTGEPPLGNPGYDHFETYELVRENGDWRIDAFSWPYEHCPVHP